MATLHIGTSTVRVQFTLLEQIFSLRDFTVQRDDIGEVSMHGNPLAAFRGFRSPGLSIPMRRKVGIWRRPGQRIAVAATSNLPAIRLRLPRQRYDAVVISSPKAAEWAATLERTVE